MMNHTGALWQYLGTFVLYTLGAVGLIYGAYWYARRSSGLLSGGSTKVDPQVPTLQVESSLPLDPRNTVYVIRSGSERFLIAASGEETNLLSKLEPVASEVTVEEIPVVTETERLEPWFAPPVVPRTVPRRQGFGARFAQSIQWIVSSRMK
ncbi:flagellar biosynthetic protein FliO [Vampirovibrio chlorellavorus]|uniref:flagellar biosynthetic protein FliO n=1 Tax=Vampirovibrio chlorellavorus TaxID=758823 RepID=UPI0026ED9F32|nr:flagellar biosynthetic protein FliO [Vampirovibrio chlorellavorus]